MKRKKIFIPFACISWSENDLIDINGRAEILPMLSMLSLSEDKWRFNASLAFSFSNPTKRIKWSQQQHVKNFFSFIKCNIALRVRNGISFAISISSFSIHYYYFLYTLYVNNQQRKHSSTSSRYRMTFDISSICEFISISNLHKTNESLKVKRDISFKLREWIGHLCICHAVAAGQ